MSDRIEKTVSIEVDTMKCKPAYLLKLFAVLLIALVVAGAVSHQEAQLPQADKELLLPVGTRPLGSTTISLSRERPFVAVFTQLNRFASLALLSSLLVMPNRSPASKVVRAVFISAFRPFRRQFTLAVYNQSAYKDLPTACS